MASKDIMQFVNGLHKRGNDSFYDAVQAASAKQLQNQALSNAGMLGAVGLGVGAGGRGIAGLLQLVSRNMQKQPRSLPKPITIDLPIHETEEKDVKKSSFLDQLTNTALELNLNPTASKVSRAARKLVQLIGRNMPKATAKGETKQAGLGRKTMIDLLGSQGVLGSIGRGIGGAADAAGNYLSGRSQAIDSTKSLVERARAALGPSIEGLDRVRNQSSDLLNDSYRQNIFRLPKVFSKANPEAAAQLQKAYGDSWTYALPERQTLMDDLKSALGAVERTYTRGVKGVKSKIKGKVDGYRQTSSKFKQPAQTAAKRVMQGGAAGLAGATGLGIGSLFGGAPKQSSAADFLKGDYAQSVSGVPWAIPAAIGAGTAGVAGGWKAMDYLMDKRRKGDLDIELEKAKKEYEQALEENNHLKTAGFNKVAQALNTLCDTIEQKTASMADGLGTAAGLYGLYGGVSGLAAATLAYNWGKKRQRKAIVERALKERRKRRFNSQPATVYARPLATPKSTPPAMQTAPPEENTLEGLDI